ncbi:MAG: S1 RNA-binding domain-containing protein [Patescibacteria group bacterium]
MQLTSHDASVAEQSADGAVKKDRLMDALFKRAHAPLPKEGEVADGTVIAVLGTRVYVDLAYGTGIIYGREYQLGRHMLRKVRPGDHISAKIIQYENEEGYIELSVSDADRERVWKELIILKNNKEAIALKVLEANKGGLVFEYQGVKGFLPVSQLTQDRYPRVEGGDKNKILTELQKFVGEEFSLIVLDASAEDGKLIFTEKGSTPEELQKKLEKYAVGTTYKGEVTGVVDFGVFVKLEDGLEGLVHISEIDWSLVENPSDLYKAGDAVEVKVIGIEGDKISLSIKALKPDPWKVAAYQKGDIVEGRVTKLSKIGAFIQVLDKNKPDASGKIFGLSHISEFGSQQKMESLVKVGELYPFQISVYDSDHHKLSLLYLGEGKEVKAEVTSAPVEEKKAE